jgi:hypothetical protein
MSASAIGQCLRSCHTLRSWDTEWSAPTRGFGGDVRRFWRWCGRAESFTQGRLGFGAVWAGRGRGGRVGRWRIVRTSLLQLQQQLLLPPSSPLLLFLLLLLLF